MTDADDRKAFSGETRLADLSKYRAELMGLAILFVVMFHVWMPRSYFFFPLRRLGNVGVDMFLFLSGMGLWFAWTRLRSGKPSAGTPGKPLGQSLRHFFSRRFLRIWPVWLVVAAFFYITNCLDTPGGGYSPDVPNLIANILIGWSFWRVDDLTFWYVPATMLLYCIAPFYMELIRRCPSYRWLPVAAMVLAAMVCYVPLLHSTVGHLEIFFSRIPIFLIGINAGGQVMNQRQMERGSIWMLVITFALSMWLCLRLEYIGHTRFPLFLERMAYIPLTVSALLLECRLLSMAPRMLLRLLAFLGGVSLEIYLIHIEYVLKPLGRFHLGYCLTALAVLLISVPAAWLLQKAVAFIVNGLQQGFNHKSDRKT